VPGGYGKTTNKEEKMSRRTRVPLAVLAVSMLMVVVAAGAALAITKTCKGNNNYCFGTANPDTIYDGRGSDIINARASGDVVRAGHRLYDYDEVYGGRGADRIHALDDFDETGYYFDRINGGRGYDVCYVDDEDKVSNCEVVHRR
jgi:hypothetical protein